MSKKFILLATSVTALLAFAAPAAQASGPLITNSLGEATKTITAVSTNTTTVTALGTLVECTTTKLHLNLASNESTTSRGKGTGAMEGTIRSIPATHVGHCASSSGAVVEITNVEISNLHLEAKGSGVTTGTATFSYTYDLRSATGAGLIAECTFGGTVPVKKTGTSTLNVEGKITKTAGSAFCPGEGTLKGDFTVFDETGAAATVH
jgi:hypothetical protein